MPVAKTNAARLLDSQGVPYSLHAAPASYLEEGDLSAVALARSLGVDEACVYKTLVARGDRHGVFLACIMAAHELDLKKAALATGNKSVVLVHLKEVLPLTGYVRGGCSPLGTRKAYPVLLDETAIVQERIFVSAGQRGVQLCLAPDDLVRATGGQYADVGRAPLAASALLSAR